MQTLSVPVMATGVGLTVTIAVAAQLPIVYDMVVVPRPTPVTLPKPSTVPTVTIVLDHVPPAVASVSAVVKPSHTASEPVIAAGCRFTVTIVVTAQLPIA